LEENGYAVGGKNGVKTFCKTVDTVILEYLKDDKVTGVFHGWASNQGYVAVAMAVRCINDEIVPEDMLSVFPYSMWTIDNIAELEPLVNEASVFDFKP